jgi:23S rRNA (cytidine2498-2'-O)-methyltransferase
MTAPTTATAIVGLCRAGFEPESVCDLEALADAAHASVAAPTLIEPGVVALPLRTAPEPGQVTRTLARRPPVFAREVSIGTGPHALGTRDRIAPIVTAARALNAVCGTLWLEYPDTNDGKQLSSMCRRLEPLLTEALRTARVLTQEDTLRRPRLHVVFTARDSAFVATSMPEWNSTWPMGIARLKMPRDVPSRSTLKLAEAFAIFLGEDEQLRLLRPGLRAVDLGAAPGGWTWQLAHRGLRVTAVDNGPLKGEVRDDPLVTHVREDGLKYRPKRPVDWLVCDIVEQPIRIAELVARWIADGVARRAIFNLKLPMKKRYDEVERCSARILDITRRAGVNAELRLRQLYHDREEVTGYLARAD